MTYERAKQCKPGDALYRVPIFIDGNPKVETCTFRALYASRYRQQSPLGQPMQPNAENGLCAFMITVAEGDWAYENDIVESVLEWWFPTLAEAIAYRLKQTKSHLKRALDNVKIAEEQIAAIEAWIEEHKAGGSA